MKNNPVLETHYNAEVWTNKEFDDLRRTECLCKNCAKGYCPAAHSLYVTCKFYDLALMVTRCKEFERKESINE